MLAPVLSYQISLHLIGALFFIIAGSVKRVFRENIGQYRRDSLLGSNLHVFRSEDESCLFFTFLCAYFGVASGKSGKKMKFFIKTVKFRKFVMYTDALRLVSSTGHQLYTKHVFVSVLQVPFIMPLPPGTYIKCKYKHKFREDPFINVHRLQM